MLLLMAAPREYALRKMARRAESSGE